MNVRGRDVTGDLVDCAAAPTGPAEYRNIDLLAFASAISAPFSIPVRTDVDVGPPFAKLGINPHQSALAAIESAARQRSALVTSDGVGGLVLTRGGIQRAPWHLVRGENLFRLDRKDEDTHRFSDVFVVGQSASGAGSRVGQPAAASVGAAPSASPPAPTGTASAGIIISGHAQDPDIKRWRPYVRQTKSQSGMTSAQEQAEWCVRVFRAQAIELRYSVLDWRAGPPSGAGPAPQLGALWRPNTVAAVYDPQQEINGDMLIAGVSYQWDEKNESSELRVVGLAAYEEINEAYRRRGAFGSPQVQASARAGRR
jgi:prophage tail gpP-like protein